MVSVRASEVTPSVEGMTAMTLTETDAAMLELERSWWQYPGAKEQAIRDRFDLSSTAFYQRLNRLIDTPAALAHDPLTVKRLQRLRDQRQRSRAIARGF